jgi:hypothetical protein
MNHPSTLLNGRAGTALAVLMAATVVTLGATTSPAMADDCPNAAARAQNNSTNLPDCRAYELVTPPFKEGFGAIGPIFSNSGGVTFGSPGNFAGNGLGSILNRYVANRTPTGWVTISHNPSGPSYAGATGSDAVSADLRTSLWQMRRPDETATINDFYLRAPDGAFTRIGPSRNPATLPPSTPAAGGELPGVNVAGASADLSHFIFGLRAADAYPDGSTGSSLYEYPGDVPGVPRLVGVDNHGDLISNCAIDAGAGGWTRSHAISTDGRVIFMTVGAADGGISCGDPATPAPQLWARAGGSTSFEVSASHCTRAAGDPGGVCNGPADAQFEGANAHGTRVYFTTSQQLVNGDIDQTKDLYACDLPAETPAPVGRANPCSSLSEVSGAATDGDVQGVVRVSDDGSRVYFVAHGILAANHGANDLAAVAGDNNLYVWQKDAAHPAGTTTFVGKLDAGDSTAWGDEYVGGGHGREAQTTDGGGVLVIAASTPLVASDTDSARDVYRYDADSGSLVEVSSGPDGGNADAFDAVLSTNVDSAALPTVTPRTVMTADGTTIVFRTSDVLVSGDVNTTEDVYAWHDGRVFLISSGQPRTVSAGAPDSAYITDSGQDLYFTSTDRLTPADTDTQQDIYDARVDGGFDFSQPAPCVGDACQAPRRPSPPVSMTTNGQGEAAPAVPALSLASITASQRSGLARMGTLTLKVTSNTPAVLSANGTATIARRLSKVASARRAVAAGTSSLTLKLSKKARAQLAADGKLTVKVVVSSSKVALTKTATLKLTHAKVKPKAKRASSKRRTPDRSTSTTRGAKS